MSVHATSTAGSPSPDDSAVHHFASKLRYETDPSEVAAARAAKEALVILDVRNAASSEQGHLPGALHLPTQEITDRLGELPPPAEDPRIVVYCWGPGCNGSTKAALILAEAGYRDVREMIGGFEYWAREGLAIVTATGRRRLPIDELVAPLPAPLTTPASSASPVAALA